MKQDCEAVWRSARNWFSKTPRFSRSAGVLARFTRFARHSRKDACIGIYCNKLFKLKPSYLEQPAILSFGSLPSPCHNEHRNVDDFSVRQIVPGLDHTLDHQQLVRFAHGLATVFENGDRPFVIPIVENVFEDVRVTARGY